MLGVGRGRRARRRPLRVEGRRGRLRPAARLPGVGEDRRHGRICGGGGDYETMKLIIRTGLKTSRIVWPWGAKSSSQKARSYGGEERQAPRASFITLSFGLLSHWEHWCLRRPSTGVTEAFYTLNQTLALWRSVCGSEGRSVRVCVCVAPAFKGNRGPLCEPTGLLGALSLGLHAKPRRWNGPQTRLYRRPFMPGQGSAGVSEGWGRGGRWMVGEVQLDSHFFFHATTKSAVKLINHYTFPLQI